MLELGIHILSGRREAWDSAQYWTLGRQRQPSYPAPSGSSRAARLGPWTPAVIPSQVMTMMLRNGELGGLWPLALIATTILSTPFLLCAFVGSRFRTNK